MSDKIKLIYIAGNSFSGSTLLSFLVGSNPTVENLGELKFFDKKKDKNCTCGQTKINCEFWKHFDQDEYNLTPKLTLIEKYTFLIKTLLGLKIKNTNNNQFDDLKLIQDLYKEKLATNPDMTFILDSSKSIWRLNQLVQFEEIELYVIYIKRGIYANIASMKKRPRFNFFRALYTYKFKHLLIKKYLKLHKLSHINIEHEDVCADAQKELDKIGKHLKLTFENYEENLKNRKFHVTSGNYGTNKQILKGFEGVNNEVSTYPNLSKLQLKILDLLS